MDGKDLNIEALAGGWPPAHELTASPWRAMRVRDAIVSVDSKIPTELGATLSEALAELPDSVLQRFFHSKKIVAADDDPFNAAEVSDLLNLPEGFGIRFDGAQWLIRAGIASEYDEPKLSVALWYSAGVLLSHEVHDPLFDAPRFRAEFARYMRGRVNSPFTLPSSASEHSPPGADPLYARFVDLIYEARACDGKAMDAAFRQALAERGLARPPDPAFRRTISANNPWVVQKMLRELVDTGLSFPTAFGNTVNITVQNAKAREKPESSHRVGVSYYSAWLNDLIAEGINAVIPDFGGNAMIAPGIVGSYERFYPNKRMSAALLAGILGEFGIATEAGIVSSHTYIGLPLTVMGDPMTGVDEILPFIEFGLQLRAEDGSAFIGVMFSTTVPAKEAPFAGLMARMEI